MDRTFKETYPDPNFPPAETLLNHRRGGDISIVRSPQRDIVKPPGDIGAIIRIPLTDDEIKLLNMEDQKQPGFCIGVTYGEETKLGDGIAVVSNSERTYVEVGSGNKGYLYIPLQQEEAELLIHNQVQAKGKADISDLTIGNNPALRIGITK